MTQTTNQRIIARSVQEEMGSLSISALAEKAGVDHGTIGDFLNGYSWPKTGSQRKIEAALGWPEGYMRHMEVHGPEVPMPGHEQKQRTLHMTGAEHFAEAERLADLAYEPFPDTDLTRDSVIALAQVHATLAHAAATAYTGLMREDTYGGRPPRG